MNTLLPIVNKGRDVTLIQILESIRHIISEKAYIDMGNVSYSDFDSIFKYYF